MITIQKKLNKIVIRIKNKIRAEKSKTILIYFLTFRYAKRVNDKKLGRVEIAAPPR